jgi:formylglycine-generating enzyme required for sulfatase activity
MITFALLLLLGDEQAILTRFAKELLPLTPGMGRYPAAANVKPIRFATVEVTQELYQWVMNETPSRWQGPRNSVEMVSYPEAVAFTGKLTQKLRQAKRLAEDEVVRLPTLAEWQYACRAGTTTMYSFGDSAEQLGEFGWYTQNAAGNDPPVAAKKPNPWGLHDLHGYLWEWCEGPEGKPVIAGGSWTSSAAECASTSFKAIPPTTRQADIGFRVVVEKQRPKTGKATPNRETPR